MRLYKTLLTVTERPPLSQPVSPPREAEDRREAAENKHCYYTITARPSRAKVISLLPLRVGRRVLKELGHVATEAAVQLGGKELGRFRHGEDAVGALQAAHEVVGALHRPHRQPARW